MKLRTLLIAIICIGVTSLGWAQSVQVQTLEYFFDTDPGFGDGTQITINTPAAEVGAVSTLSTSGLSTGFHTLYLRGKSTEGHWGAYESKVVYVNTATITDGIVEVSGLEYFFDTDPGFGLGTQISTSQSLSVSLTNTLATSGLSTGFHTLYLRGKTPSGRWGAYESKVVYVNSAAATDGIVEVSGLEYFFDTDPGFGLGTQISTSQSLSVSLTNTLATSGLSTGFHTLYLRGKTPAGHWGAYESKVVYVNTAVATDGIVEVSGLEYFFDADPGLGQGTQISTNQALSVSLSNSLNTSGLTKGFHTLYLRGRTPSGRWGAYESKVVYVQPDVAATVLTNRAEYFFDTDPGVGQATQVIYASTQELNTSIEIASQSLATGPHKLYLRAKAENGGWGMYEVADVFVYPDILTENFETGLPVSSGTGTYTLASGSWAAANIIAETSTVRGGTKAARLFRQNGSLTSPQFSGVSTVEFYYALPANGEQHFKVMKSLDGGSYTEMASLTATGTTFQKFSQTLNHAGAAVNIRILTDATTGSSHDLIIDDFQGTSINPVLVNNIYPNNNSGNVKLDSTFAIVFNQTIVKALEGNIYIIDRADSTVAEIIPLSAVTIDGDSAYFSPTALQHDKNYAVTISSGAFKEQSNTISFNGILTNQVWKFQTVPAPAAPSFQFTNVIPAQGFSFPNVDAKSKTSSISTYQITGQNLEANIILGVVQTGSGNTPGFDISLDGTVFVTQAVINQGDATNKSIQVRAIVPANNGRTYTGKITHTSTNAETIEIPVTVTELLGNVLMSITSPAQNTTFDIGDDVLITWEVNNLVNEPLTIEYSTDLMIWSSVVEGTRFSGLGQVNFDTDGKAPGTYYLRLRAASLPNPQTSEPVSFTLVAPSGFAEAFATQIPAGWTVNNAFHEDNPALGYEGVQGAVSISSGTDNYLQTPYLTGVNNISFFYRAASVGPDGAQFEVLISTDGINFDNIASLSSNLENYEQFSHMFDPEFSGYIRINTLGSGDRALLIDNFSTDGTVGTPPVTIAVTTPNGGETWQVGSTQNISWTSNNFGENDELEIRLSLDGGATFPTVLANNTSSSFASNYQWTVTNNLTSTARIKVVNTTKTVEDQSDADFQVSPVPTFVAGFSGGIPESWSSNNANHEDNPALGLQGQSGAVVIQGNVNGNFLQTPLLQGVNFFSFYFRAVTPGDPIRFEIKISTDGINYTTIQVIQPFTGSGDLVADVDPNGYQFFSHTFDPSFDGFILISSNTGGEDFLIDNFEADGVEDVIAPVISEATAELIAPSLNGRLISDELGTVYYIVYTTLDIEGFTKIAPTSAADLKADALSGPDNFSIYASGSKVITTPNEVVSFTALSELPLDIIAGGFYNVYYTVEDAAGNFSEIESFLNVEATEPTTLSIIAPTAGTFYLGTTLPIRISTTGIGTAETLIFELSTNGGSTYPYQIASTSLEAMTPDGDEYFFNFVPNQANYVTTTAKVRVKYNDEVLATSNNFSIQSPTLSDLSVAFYSQNTLIYDQETTISFNNNGLTTFDLYLIVPGNTPQLIEDGITLSENGAFQYGYTPTTTASNAKFRIVSGNLVYETGFFNIINPVQTSVLQLNFGVALAPSSPVLSYTVTTINEEVTVTSTNPDKFEVSLSSSSGFGSSVSIGAGSSQPVTVYVRFPTTINDNQLSTGTINNTFTNSGSQQVTVPVSVQGRSAASDPTIVIIVPTDAQELVSNSVTTIRWGLSSVSSASIYFSLDGGNSYNLIEDQLNSVITQFDWLVPEVASQTTCIIRIIDDAGNADDVMVGFEILPAPAISNLTLINNNTELVIDGSGFSSVANENKVIFPGFPDITVYPTSAAPTQLTVSVPTGAVSGFIQVDVTNKGTAISPDQLELTGIIVSPDRAQIGQTVFINGSGVDFQTATTITVTFRNGNQGPIEATEVAVQASDNLAVVVPEGVIADDIIIVDVDAVTLTTANTFKVQSFDFTPKTAGIFETVTITGINTKFLNGTQVFVNGVQATGLSILSDTQLSFTVPQGANTGKISISTNDGFYDSKEDLNVALHTISSISATKSGHGTQITVQGTRFTSIPNNGVKVNGVTLTAGSPFFQFSVNYNTDVITLTVPSNAVGTGKISVTQGGVEVESLEDFTVIPRITSVNPNQAAPTATVTLSGSYFSNTNNTVYFNDGKPAAIQSQSNNTIVVTVPEGAIDGKITVVNNDVAEQGLSATDFDVVAAPVFTSFSPLKAAAGQVVTVVGQNFQSPNPSQVKVNGVNTSFNVIDNNTLTFTVQNNWFGAGLIEITKGGVTVKSTENFTILPKIDSWTLATGAVEGANVTISGTGFNPTPSNNELKFANNQIATINSGSNTFLNVTVPVGAITGKLTGTNKIINETVESATDFIVVPKSVITSFTPANGQVNNTLVTITGQNFTMPNVTNVQFNGTNASFNIISDTEITATVPFISTNGPITVLRAGGSTQSAETFFLAPDITSLSATTLAVGASLNINGTFLNNLNQVLVGDVNATITFNNNFSVAIITVPNMTPGSYKVKVIKNGLEDISVEDLQVVPAHTITSFQIVVNKGENLVITGTNLNSPVPTSVTLNGVSASVVSNTGTELTVTVPTNMNNAGQGKIVITRAGLTVTSTADLYIRHTITTNFTTPNYVVGQSMTISGTNFRFPNSTAVTVNGVNATINSLNETSIAITVPNAVGTGKVVITKPAPVGTVESATDITVVPRAILSSYTPTIQNVGQNIVITGENFTAPDVTNVVINNVSAQFTVNSATQITATVPSISTQFNNNNIQGNVQITRAGLTESLGTFTVRHAVSSVSSTTVAAGASVTLSGSYFANPSPTLTLGGNSVSVSSNVNNVTFTVPPATTPGSHEIVLTRLGSEVSAGTITVLAPHTISSLSTDRQVRSGEVVITGTFFDNNPQLFINGVQTTSFVVDNSTQITLNLPSNVSGGIATIMIRRGGLDVSTFDGTNGSFTGTAQLYVIPTITTDVSLTNYVLGQQLDISGSNFSNPNVNSVTVDGKAVQTTVLSDNLLRITLSALDAGNPLVAGTFDVKIIKTTPNPDLEVTLAQQITLVGQSNITQITEANAPAGATVTITGTEFTAPDVTAVSINGASVGSGNFTVVDANTITAKVPSGAQAFASTNNIQITRGGLSVFASDPFIVDHQITGFLKSNFNTLNTSLERVVEGETIFVEGSHFESGASITSVKVNDVDVTPTFISNNRLQVVIPDGAAGIGKVVIVRRGITVESAQALTISPKAVINEITPTARIAGSTVTLSGANFTLPNVSAVAVNGANATFNIVNNSTIKVTIPNNATATGQVTVTRNNVVSTGVAFSVIPRIFNFTNSGIEGGSVTINGSHFGNSNVNNEVYFTSATGLDLQASITSATAQSIVATIPTGALTGPIKVTNTTSSQSATSSANFNIIAPPSNFNISPASGPVASQFTITGNNLNGVSSITVNGTSATTFLADPDGTNILVTVPSIATTGTVSIIKAGLTYNAGTFTVSPKVVSFPSLAVVGSDITIVGKTFLGATGVTINGENAPIVGSAMATQVTVTVAAASAGIGNIVVTTPSGSGTSATTIEVKSPPILASFTPTSGTENDEVTITGTDLLLATFVKFNSKDASFVINSETEIVAKVPAAATTGKISLGRGNYSSTSTADFEYIKSPNDPPAILASVATIAGNRFTGNVTADKIGVVYYVAQPTGQGIPTAAAIKTAAQGGTSVNLQALAGSGSLPTAFVGADLTKLGTFVVGNSYSMHFVAEDNFGNLSQVNTVANIIVQAPIPLITLTAPNGGQTWVVGSTQNITWTTENIPGSDGIEIELSTDNGENFTNITTSTFGALNGNFAWTVSNSISAQALIRIKNTTQPTDDVSNAVFTIIGQPTLTLSGAVPEAGFTITGVNSTAITARSFSLVAQNLQGDVQIGASFTGTPSFEISSDGTNYSTNLSIPQATANGTSVFVRPTTRANNGRSYAGSLNITTTNVNAINMAVTVTELSQPAVINVLTPEQAVTVNAQGVVPITWEVTNLVETEPIQIRLRREDQDNVTVLLTATNATKNYTFNVNGQESGRYYVVISTTQLPGTVQAKDSATVVIDVTPPVVTVDPLQSNLRSPSLSGTIDEQATVSVVISGSDTAYPATVANGRWTVAANTIAPALADGTYNITATATDLVGNVASDQTNNELKISRNPVALAAKNVVPFKFTAAWNAGISAQSYLVDVSTSPNFETTLSGYKDRTVNVTTELEVSGDQLYHKRSYYYRLRIVYGNNEISDYSNVIRVTLPASAGLEADSVALRSLYNATDGNNWVRKTNWLQSRVIDWEGVTFNGTRISSLSLVNNNLKGDATNTTIGSMTGLTSIDLSDNEIEGIPNLGNITALTNANLDQNRLAFDDLQRQTNVGIITFGTQKKLLESFEVILEQNQAYTVDRTVGGEGNIYTWTRDGIALTDQSNGTIEFTEFAFENEGKYEVTVTNPAFEGVSLSTNPIQVYVSSLERDRLALLAVYNANGGTNWVGATGWPNAPIEQWAGVTISNSRVTAVNLSGFGLTGNIPEEFTTLASVANINLSNNKIDGLPNFSRMTNLSSLDLSKNSLEFDAIIKNLSIPNFNFSEQAPITLKVEERVREGVDYNLSIDVDGTDLSYQWYFNGEAIEGATATEYSIKGINYETMGDYRCDISNAQVSAVVPGFALSTGDFEILAIADIGGTVKTLQQRNLESGSAVLYRVQPVGTPYEFVAETPIVNGVYNFKDVILGDYIVRFFGPEAIYFPTYYRAAATWSKGDKILRRKDDNTKYDGFIFFNPPPLRPGPNNRNEVVGQLAIDDDNFKTTGRVSARRRVANVGVAFSRLRATNRGEEDVFELIAYVVTDENGVWEQPNLPDGTYQIVMEFPGIPMDESSFVEFNLDGTGTVDGLKLVLDAEILPTGIVVTKIATTAIIDAYFKELNVFPNPTSKYLNITYERLNEQGLQWQVINMNGQQMMQGEVPSGFDQTVTLDVEHLNNGMYMLRIIDPANHNNNQVATVRFIVTK